MKYKVTVILPEIETLEEDEDLFRELVKEHLANAIEADDSGEEELEYTVEEMEEDF